MSKEKFVKPLHLACSDDEMRPALSLIRIKGAHAVATNAHVIIKQKLSSTTLLNAEEIKKLEGRLIHKNVWKELCDATAVSVEDNKIVAITDAGKTIFEFADEATLFPEVETVLDTHEINSTQVIGVNAKLMEIFRKVFQTEQLKLNFNGSTKGILVEPIGLGGEFGILMPLALD